MTHYCKTIWSPVGELTLVADDRGLAAILWENDRPDRVRLGTLTERADHPVLLETERQLAQYFAGERRIFDVPLLLAIPFGETRSYGEIADQLGAPGASRAVGAANGRNPISIIAPCHRVVGSTGKLTGFAGGLEAKRFLLDLEAVDESSSARISGMSFHHSNAR